MISGQKIDYRRYRRYFIDLGSRYAKKKEAKIYTGITLSLLTVAFFGIFALRPTFITIASLIREQKDKEIISEQLEQKINNLRQAQTSYSLVVNSINFVNQALPQDSSLAVFAYQIEALAQGESLTIKSLTFDSTPLLENKQDSQLKEVVFSLSLSGDFGKMKNFLSSLTNLRRIVTIESVDFSQSTKEEESTLTLNISGKTHYFPKGEK